MNTKKVLETLTLQEQEDVYRAVWKRHVSEDVLARLRDAYSMRLCEISEGVTDEELKPLCDQIADIYVYSGKYDCTIDYWSNLDSLIDDEIDAFVDEAIASTNDTMHTFRVEAKMTSYAYLDVKAPTKEKAMEIASNTDGGEFISTEYGDWEITGCELKEKEEVA